tara:strand:- start:10452 stop:11555 length:1104 start_codon:yes stop_codon:yes gene_type:complete
MQIKIFFFIADFKYGGASNAVLSFLKKLNKKIYNCHIIYIGNSDYKKLIPKNVEIHEVKKRFFFFNTLLSFFEIKKIVNKNINSRDENLFISNIHYSNILSIFFLRNLKNLKIFLFERTSLKELDIFFSLPIYIKNKIIKLLIKKFYLKADSIFSNSITVKNELKRIGIKTNVIYSGSLKKILHKKKLNPKKFYKIIAVGRLTKQKNYEVLIDSVELIYNKNFKLYIYGDGDLFYNLQSQIIQKKLQKKIKLMRHENNKNKIYGNADLLVHTSLFEGLPNSIVDAINYSVPVIAFDGYGGISEILGNGKYGKLYKKNNKYEISRNIKTFIINPKILQKKILIGRQILYKFLSTNATNSLERQILNNK